MSVRVDRATAARLLRQAGQDLPEPPKAKRRGVPNATELRFAKEVLDARELAGEIDGYEFEGLKLKIAAPGDDTSVAFYTIDFVAWKGTAITGFETKGWWREAGRLRLKVAAERYPMIRFFGVKLIDGAWSYERFGRHEGN